MCSEDYIRWQLNKTLKLVYVHIQKCQLVVCFLRRSQFFFLSSYMDVEFVEMISIKFLFKPTYVPFHKLLNLEVI